jgi:phosphatidate cytidylyltransferase
LNNIVKRSITGIVYVVLMLAGVSLHPFIYAIVFGVLLFFTQKEFYQLMGKRHNPCHKTAGLITGILLFAICFGAVSGFIPQKSCLIFIPALIFVFIIEIFRDNDKVIENSAVTITGLIYVALPFSLLNFIVFPGYPVERLFNPQILIGIFFITWVYDTFAYLSGYLLGRHKICEKISPQKTWEGLIAGTVFALIMGIINAVIFKSTTIAQWLIITVIIIVAGTLGDLFESKIKREIDIKDSGNILPGHGGLLDRFDSLLFIIPVVYVWLTLSGNI